jgi:hypothetical protein
MAVGECKLGAGFLLVDQGHPIGFDKVDAAFLRY